jgi:triosephosphate isomerase
VPIPLIAGNWKMHRTLAEARELARAVMDAVAGVLVPGPEAAVEVVLAPPFPALAAVREVVQGSGIRLAAQNMHWADQGAFTGEVSPVMVAELAERVILGHSERRRLCSEIDAEINRKVHAAYAHGLGPVVCIGESAAEREAGQTDEVLVVQLAMSLDGIDRHEAARLVIAYEPVWAIGTGRACAPVEAARVAGFIRTWLAHAFGPAPAAGARILYGGSVTASNIGPYLAADEIAGALVGGTSLDAGAFAAIVGVAAAPAD